MSLKTIDRRLPLAGTFNLRDLGGYETKSQPTKWRKIFRSDSPHALDDRGVYTLLSHEINTVIDLRSPEEVAHRPNPFKNIKEVNFHHISLFDDSLFFHEPTGNPPLLDIYKGTLDRRKEELKDILTALSDSAEGSVLFHCSAGKDRTGLVAALTLSLVGVDESTIVEDYALTEKFIEPHIPKFLSDAQARGLDLNYFTPLMDCKADFMSQTFSHLKSKYGSIQDYLYILNISNQNLRNLHLKLIEEK